MDGGAWWAAVHGVAKSQTRLSDFTFTFHFPALKEMATHSDVLAWRIPGMGEPGGLPSMGSHGVGHDWSNLAAAAAASQLYLHKTGKMSLKIILRASCFIICWASLVAQRLKCLPAMQETWVRSLDGEDPLEKEMATYSSILAWRIPLQYAAILFCVKYI